MVGFLKTAGDYPEWNFPFINSYIIIPFLSSIDEIASRFYHNRAYAVDIERRAIIVFNLDEDTLQELKRLYPLSAIYDTLDSVPQHYIALFTYVNAQIETNLKRVKAPSSLRWLGANANPNSGIIKIASCYHLHGVDANNPPNEIK